MDKNRWEKAKDNAKPPSNNDGFSQYIHNCPPPPPPTPSTSGAAHPKDNSTSVSRISTFLLKDSITEKLIKLKNKNPVNKMKKVLRFGKVNQTVGCGYRCGMCEKTFIQEHDCHIHELQVCIPKKGVRKMEKKRSGLGEIAYSPNSSNIIHPTNVVKHMKHPDPSNKQVP